ncbi:GGDEF domain-containing protein [Gallaecimonas sp. GXIMD4217]|uniref:GGDEF domain-containing protein n=1 Tax=Gallaecimonas sp. GXIMD4217 TaxID=3131927 RepID=UPI00311ACFD7
MDKVKALFRKTLELLGKYQLPPTPQNYALWYAYASQEKPELNEAIDSFLLTNDALSVTVAQELYDQHLAASVWRDAQGLRENMTAMAHELATTVKDTQTDTHNYQQNMEARFARLEGVESGDVPLDMVVDEVRNLVQDARKIGDSTRFLNDRLVKAESEIGALRDALSKTRAQALRDVLTGLLNRRAFDMELAAAKPPVSLVLMDLDHFKTLNDTFGHLLGDQVLKAVAKLLNQACYDGIKAFRFGGEEFVLLVPKPLKLAQRFAESLRQQLTRLAVTDRRSGRTVDAITASFGVAEAAEHDNAASLVEKADKQLYEAKKLGRNRVMPVPGVA